MKKYKNYSELEKFIADNEESELVEYKSNLKDPYRIGQYISALTNSSITLQNCTTVFMNQVSSWSNMAFQIECMVML